jgi:hypothetical protein
VIIFSSFRSFAFFGTIVAGNRSPGNHTTPLARCRAASGRLFLWGTSGRQGLGSVAEQNEPRSQPTMNGYSHISLHPSAGFQRDSNGMPAAAAGRRNSASWFMISARSSGASARCPRARNLRHCDRFSASSPNASVSASGAPVGFSVLRQRNVASMARVAGLGEEVHAKWRRPGRRDRRDDDRTPAPCRARACPSGISIAAPRPWGYALPAVRSSR